MRRLFLVIMVLAAAATTLSAQYPFHSIRQIQQVPAESLVVADSLVGLGILPRWSLEVSPHMGDTVTTVGLVVVPPGVITYTTDIWTMLLYDTTSGIDQWGGILLRGNLGDSTKLKQDGFLNVSPGDVITLTGVISEFPSGVPYSGTQLAPLAGNPITVIEQDRPLPSPVVKEPGDFYKGIFSGGKIQYGTGEPYEGMYVEMHNLTIDNKVNTSRGTFSAVDALGNEISDYDWSHFFTLGHGTSSLPLWPADTNWAKIYSNMGVGLRIDTIRGVITTCSGSESPRGYRIAPIYPSDIVFTTNPPPPLITTHRRNPVVVTADSAARVSVRVTQAPGGTTPKTVSLLYSLNNGAYTAVPMSYQASDTTYVGVIGQQVANTGVRYFVQVADTLGQVIRLANSSTYGGIAGDTSKGVFFYTSLARPLTIYDVQYTPYINGRSPYLGAVTSLSGIVTADTLHLSLQPATTGSTNAWYMQSTNQPWSGLWLTSADSAVQRQMSDLRNGDSISVTGTVQEQFDVTRLGNITAVTKISSGNPVPTPVLRTTRSLNVGNGTPSAEAYEGMLVTLSNLTVTDVAPTYSDDTEYLVDDGSGPVVVQWSGKYKYSNRPADSASGKTILRVGNRIGSLTGILYYSFQQYKFVPRTDADFVDVVLGVAERTGTGLPSAYELSQNYPNPFNPSTTIRYAIPRGGLTTLKVYNLLGQEVATLVNEVQEAGTYAMRFNASSYPSGVYFFRIQSGSFSAVKKMILMK